ncbi:NDUFA8 [Cordylochernes scorpioides]|uniref:NDUFA8 n=1 Tax=Cordylochernes scorpioides TaxID=51811 RepID=A0ABY6L383_9ARAC|nr:NDUFA8 [Cordylochernes scorpioides]
MPLTEHHVMPSEEELTVQEINVSGPMLVAASLHMGKYCDEYSKEFMLCRNENNDPRKCLKEGRDVTKCGIEFFQMVKESCAESMENFARCVGKSYRKPRIFKCHEAQEAFSQCMLEKLNIEKPGIGYFSLPRKHHTERPKPAPPILKRYPENPIPDLPEDFPKAELPDCVVANLQQYIGLLLLSYLHSITLSHTYLYCLIQVNYIDFLEVDKDVQVAGEQSIEEIVKEKSFAIRIQADILFSCRFNEVRWKDGLNRWFLDCYDLATVFRKYDVQNENGLEIKRHVEQLKPRAVDPINEDKDTNECLTQIENCEVLKCHLSSKIAG